MFDEQKGFSWTAEVDVLTEREKKALVQWYSQDHMIDEARKFAEQKILDRLEDYLQKTCILPLGRHDQLPEYMLDDEGQALFPTNLDPRVDLEKWQDAVEVAWEVMAEKIGVVQDDVHRSIASAQQLDWDAFMKSVEERKKQRD